jgi:hypothetical protein
MCLHIPLINLKVLYQLKNQVPFSFKAELNIMKLSRNFMPKQPETRYLTFSLSSVEHLGQRGTSGVQSATDENILHEMFKQKVVPRVLLPINKKLNCKPRASSAVR